MKYLVLLFITIVSSVSRADTWTLANRSGFGDRNNISAEAAVAIGSRLCVGTRNRAAHAKIYCSETSSSAHSWTEITPTAVAWRNNKSITKMIVFREQLYVSTEQSEIWQRNLDTGTWRKVSPIWTHPGTAVGITDMAVYGDSIYIVLGAPIEVMRSADGTRWESAMAGEPLGFGRSAEAAHSARLGIFRDLLVLGTGQINPGSAASMTRAVQVWAYNGTGWFHLTAHHLGLGDSANGAIISMHAFSGDLFVGTHNTRGAQIWRGRGTSTGFTWTDATPGPWKVSGPASVLPVHAHSLQTLANATLFVGTREAPPPSSSVWSTRTGNRWVVSTASDSGLASSSDIVSTLTAIGSRLYLTTWNATLGTEVYWRRPLPLDGASSP